MSITTLEPEITTDDLAGDYRPALPDEERMRRALAAFSRVAAAVGDAGDIDELLRVVAREISALVGVERCSTYLREEGSAIFRGRIGQAGDASIDEGIKRSLAGIPADGITRELLETRRPVIVDNARVDPRTVKSSVRYWRIRSIMAVPMIFAEEIVGLIFLDDEDRPRVFTDEEADVAMVFGGLAAAAVVHTQAHTDVRARLDAAQRQVRALRRATAVDERLSDLLLEGGSLQALLDTLAELLGKPCAVFGAEGERLATALPPGPAADGVAPRLLEPEYASRPEVREALAAYEGSRVFVVGPLPGAGVLHRHVVAPVRVGEEVWGRLVVMEHKRRFTGGDMVTLRRAATLIALHVSTERKAVEADWNAGSSLAAELLGGCSDPAVVERRAARLGVRLEAPRIVMLIGSRSGGEDMPDFRAVAAAFRRVAPALTTHVTAASGAVAALVEVPGDADETSFAAAARRTLEEVRALLRRPDELVAGISTVHADRDGYRAAYQEARQVVECVRRFSPPGGPAIFTADELGTGRVFLATSDGDLVRSFAEETFGGLVDDPSKADLLTTLCAFFASMASIRRCADGLGLHENTIRYRLSRIEELTGLSVTHDPDAQLRARLSLLVLLLEGRLAPGGRGATGSNPSLEVVQAASA